MIVKYKIDIYCMLLLFITFSSCKKFVEIDPPRTELIKATVFADEATANSAVIDLYANMRSEGFASGSGSSISYLASIYADEQLNYYESTPDITAQIQQFGNNELTAENPYILGLWTDMYNTIYKTNAIIEGLASSTGVKDDAKRRLSGEAKFIRAFCYFYLVNIWGDVPLVTTTDYNTNSKIPKTSKGDVYKKIIEDLLEAQSSLPSDYSISNNERVRPNKYAATALLARTYLYTEEWSKAESLSTLIIDDKVRYELVKDLTKLNVKNSKESIWQIWSDYYPQDIMTFYLFSNPPTWGALREEFADGFEKDDKRKTYWVGYDSGFYFPTKYSSFDLTEYSTIIRLAELYLIRAESRAQLNNLSGADDDVNTIRDRAGLAGVISNNKEASLAIIEKERRAELFTELGHRWFDLKRTKRIDEVLSSTKSQWKSYKSLFPIPEAQLINDPAVTQNPGY